VVWNCSSGIFVDVEDMQGRAKITVSDVHLQWFRAHDGGTMESKDPAPGKRL